MNLKELRHTIYDGLEEMGAKLDNSHRAFISERIQTYTKTYNKMIKDELLTTQKALSKQKKELVELRDLQWKYKTTKKTEEKYVPKSRYDIPKEFRTIRQ